MTDEEQAAYDSLPETQAQLAYEKRAAANARVHCLCGRFARPGMPTQMNMIGEYEFSVHCKACGEVWIS